jgi:TPR repeat protein
VTTWLLQAALASSLAACAQNGSRARVGWTAQQLEHEQRCQGGDDGACRALGESLIGDGAIESDRNHGLVLLEVVCGTGDIAACGVLGRAYARSRGRSRARGRELLARACGGGVAQACSALGDLRADDGAGSGQDGNGTDALRIACELGDARGCELLAEAEWNDRFSGNKALALESFARACQKGRLTSCHALGRIRLDDPATRAAGVGLLTENCKHRFAASCLEVAALTAPLLSRRPDCAATLPLAAVACEEKNDEGCALADVCTLDRADEHAAALSRLEQACARRRPLACFYWAEARGQGDAGTPVAPERRRAAYEIACRSESRAVPLACTRLAAADLASGSDPAVAQRALRTLREACDDAFAPACCQLADAYRDDRWSTADRKESDRLRAKACQLGETRCCPPTTATGRR